MASIIPKTNNNHNNTFLILIGIASGISLVASILISPVLIADQTIFIILLIFIALVEIYPLELLHGEFSLVGIISFSSGLLFGIGYTNLVITLGIAAAIILKVVFDQRTRRNPSVIKSESVNAFFHLGFCMISLIISMVVFRLPGGAGSLNINWMDILGAGLVFGLIHGVLYALQTKISQSRNKSRFRWDYLALASIEILPLYWGFTTLLFIPTLGSYSIIVLGLSVSILAILLHQLSAPSKDLERRILELSTLDEISKALRSEIDLEKLLSTIQEQVTGLLNVDNFYVALLDRVDNQIWYPLAMKNGERQDWPRRTLTDRLTDRVILESKSILIPHNAGEKLTKIGLPSGEDAPCAWIGVPLITSEKTIGCLALFSLTPDIEFTEDDLNLLSILSGQASVAIEIALHNALLASDITIGRDRLTSVLNSVHDGIMLVENDNRITLLNDAVQPLTGLTRSEFIGKGLSELSPEAFAALGFSNSNTEDSLLNGSFLPDQALVKINFSNQIGNSEKYLERTITPVVSKSTTPAGWIIFLRDITEEQHMKEARELINETLVHDLRSPLSSTISALDVIQDSLANGDPAGVVEPSIQIATRSAKRVLSMVESILEISKMESGNIELSISDVDAGQLLESSIAEFTTTAHQYGVSIIKKMSTSLPKVRMDKSIIQRVLNNLIDNALKYAPDNSEVVISTVLIAEKELEISVSDRGPGVPKDYQQKIFDRFVQVPGQSSRKRGSGLGLTYCRLAVEAHEGRIWMEDRTGGGSTFLFTLPVGGPEN